MKTWYDVTLEDLEITPEIINQDLVLSLTVEEYLRHIEGMMEEGMNRCPEVAAEHLEDVMMFIFLERCRVFRGRSPEPEEIRAHLREPESVFTRHYFLNISLQATAENWQDLQKSVRRNVALLGP